MSLILQWYNEDGGNLPTTPVVGTGGSTESSGKALQPAIHAPYGAAQAKARRL